MELAENLLVHHGEPTEIESLSIDVWPAFIRGITETLPNAQISGGRC
jgi:transposase